MIYFPLMLSITRQTVADMTGRIEVLAYSDAKMYELTDCIVDALFENNFWDIVKVVIDDIMEGKE